MKRPVVSQVRNEDLVLERRERIVRAAIVVFRRHGFHVATTKDIADEAKLTQSNLYNYIRSKNDVLFLVCDNLVTLYRSAVEDAISHHSNSYDRLVAALRSIICVMSAHREEVQLLYHETHALQKRDRQIILASISKFTQSFQVLLQAYEGDHGPCITRNSRIAANFITFVPAIVALRWWDLVESAKQKEVESEILAFILRGLGIPQKP